MTKVTILLDTHVRDLMKSTARKEQTYSDFILELIEHQIACAKNNMKETIQKKDSAINNPRGLKSNGLVSAVSVES